MSKSGYVAIIGWPNAGKSTLLNKFLNYKLSIVSSKPQTTRESILGILNEAGLQMIFLDTPGWLTPSDLLQSSMKKAILRSLFDDADVALWVIDAHAFTEKELALAETFKKAGKSLVVAINKIDGLQHQAKDDFVRATLKDVFDASVPLITISGKTGQGVSELKKQLIERLPDAPAYFPTDQVTDRFERFYVCEIVREQIMQRYQEEVPHATAVLLDEFIEKAGKKDVIRLSIVVETEGQKRIVVGKAGLGIKELGIASRKQIELLLGRPVFLEMHVKVKKNWRKDPQFLKELSPAD